MINIPSEDIPKWRIKFKESKPSEVLRQMAMKYSANKNMLGFMLADIFETASTEEVQAVWTWDFDQTNRGLTDAQLDAALLILFR
jgi:hypothetical protein